MKAHTVFMINKKTIILFLVVLTLMSEVNAQNVQGIVTYNRKVDWISIMSRLPFMTQEEIERNRLTWGKYERQGRNYNLYIKGSKSLYTYGEEDTERGWSWKNEEYVLIRDSSSGKANDLVGFLGKKYLLKEKAPKTKWKILNEIKEVEGFLCMKAETRDTTKNQVIHVWFADGINFSGGPDGYGGLPGLILELNVNNGDAIVTATNISLDQAEVKLPIPKKMKGKEISFADFNHQVKKFIDQSIEGKRNPYWRIRY